MNAKLLTANADFYASALEDIAKAKKYVYIEIFRLMDDASGIQFRDLLTQKATEGVQIKLLLDAYGTPNTFFFQSIEKAGGEVRSFKKFKLFLSSTFQKNHSRNHRKLILIDDEISYIGSANITSYSLVWRESNFRLEHPITKVLKESFLNSFEYHKRYDIDTFENMPTIFYENFRIVQDAPSTVFQNVRNNLLSLIRIAKKQIIIESPYFLPGYKIRKALMKAALKGVEVILILPRHSDLRTVDLVRNKYFGQFYNSGIKIKLYQPNNLHSKLMMVDQKYFYIGSSNFDYRSFRYQFEIGLFGTEPDLIHLLIDYFEESQSHCKSFDFPHWKHRPGIEKFIEWLVTPFRHYF